MEKSPRNIMPLLDADKRCNTFEEVAIGFSKETAVNEASRCLNCKNAPCKNGCPVGVNIPEFIQQIKCGNTDGALKIIKGTNSLPAICGRVCPQESQCEKYCIRNRIDQAVAIGSLERFAADNGKEDSINKIEKNGKKVAVVGSGPAGLTCAGDLAKMGFEVTVFEAFHKAGGVLVYGIPEFRLPKKIVQKEIDNLKALGVNIKLNTVIGKTVTIDKLKKEFDAIFIGTGAGLPMFMNIPGENLNGVYSANEFLTRINLMKAYLKDSDTPVKVGKKVAVFGAGNVAMDAARTAKRMGAEEVHIIYRRSREEMPARKEEIEHAVEEGIILDFLTNPVEILGENGAVCGLKCVRMELGEPDQSGRRRPVVIKGSEYETDFDMVIVSIGTSPNPLLKNSYPQLDTYGKGMLKADEKMATSVEYIYAGGDAVTGAATVILAMGSGKTAARSIAEKLNVKVE